MTKKYAIILLYCNSIMLLGNHFWKKIRKKCLEQKLLNYCCVVDDIWAAVYGIEMSVFEGDVPKIVQGGKK